MTVPFATDAERLNDLRVALSTVKTLAYHGGISKKTLDAICQCAYHALERDIARVEATSKALDPRKRVTVSTQD